MGTALDLHFMKISTLVSSEELSQHFHIVYIHFCMSRVVRSIEINWNAAIAKQRWLIAHGAQFRSLQSLGSTQKKVDKISFMPGPPQNEHPVHIISVVAGCKCLSSIPSHPQSHSQKLSDHIVSYLVVTQQVPALLVLRFTIWQSRPSSLCRIEPKREKEGVSTMMKVCSNMRIKNGIMYQPPLLAKKPR